MDKNSTILLILMITGGVAGGGALTFLPITWIAQQILAPIDRAAKSRKAPVRFSIGDFMCLFLAIQIPLAIVHRFMTVDTMEAYWGFTLITWLIAPVIWYMGAHTLSKAQVTKGSHRFIFLGLILPLVYYGVIPFTALGFSILFAVSNQAELPLRSLIFSWAILATLFFISGRYVRWILRQTPTGNESTANNRCDQTLGRVAPPADSSVGKVPVSTFGSTAKSA